MELNMAHVHMRDGNSSNFKNILKENPYGDELIVKKMESVGHVQKRMSTRLQNPRKVHKLGSKSKKGEGQRLTIPSFVECQ